MFKPTNKYYRELGIKITQSHNLVGVCSYQEISDALGLKGKQWAWHICMIAIGKLVYHNKKNEAT